MTNKMEIVMTHVGIDGVGDNTVTAKAREPALVGVHDVSKFYGAVRALHGVRLEVHAGEVVVLAGDNGAGKSTLVKILSGIIGPDGGYITFDGERVHMHGPRDAAALGIQTIYQDLALCDNMNVTENMFLGRESRRSIWRGFQTQRARMEREASKALETLEVRIPDINAPVGALSGGQRQCVAVCRAILSDARLIMLDEPTAALGVTQRRDVLNLIDRLRSEGHGVLVVSHDLAEMLRIADRIVVLRLGTTVADRRGSDWTHDTLVSAITGSAELAIGGQR
jgi:D-xylose transport system ATP-binding protein